MPLPCGQRHLRPYSHPMVYHRTMRVSDGHARSKWGRTLDHTGFQIVPNLLLTQQGNLGLSATDIVVLLHVNRYWWTRDQNPYPSTARIAAQMGLHERSVERCLKRLEAKGAIQRLNSLQTSSGRPVRSISLKPLARSLARIAARLDEKRQSAEKDRSDEDLRGGSDEPVPSGSSSNEVPF